MNAHERHRRVHLHSYQRSYISEAQDGNDFSERILEDCHLTSTDNQPTRGGRFAWALEELQQRWTETDILIDHFRCSHKLNTTGIVAKYEQIVEGYRRRHDEILEMDKRGKEVDLFPELEMICQDIRDVDLQFYEDFLGWAKSNLKTSIVGTSAVIAIQCFVGLEVAVATALTAFFGVNSYRVKKLVTMVTRGLQKCDVQGKKFELLKQALQQLDPSKTLLYRELLIQTLGIDGYQEWMSSEPLPVNTVQIQTAPSPDD